MLQVNHLSRLVTAVGIVPQMLQLMPGASEKSVALAALRVLRAQLDHEASARDGGATEHVQSMYQVGVGVLLLLPQNLCQALTCSIMRNSG